MRSLNILAWAALALLLTVGASTAQPAPPSSFDDPEAYTVDELVVRARLPGPAWWKVSDGDSTVYVLGVPDALPKGLAWDQTILKRRLKGANQLITPPVLRVSGNVLAMPVLMAQYRDASRSGRDLEAGMSEAERRRYRAAAARAGKDAKTYAELRPWFAGLKLSNDYRRRAGLVYAEPLKSINQAARQARLKPTPALAEDDKAKSFIKTLKAVPDAAGRDCLEDAIAETEAGDAALRRAARAWAVGDVAGALAAPRSAERCWAAVAGSGRARREGMAAQAAAVEAALRRPGHAVAVFSLRSVVAREGVLARLKARGFTVETPAGAE